MFIVKILSQYVSSIIMPIIRRTRPCIWCSALVVLAVVVWSWVVSCLHCVKVTVEQYYYVINDCKKNNYKKLYTVLLAWVFLPFIHVIKF